MQMQPLVIFLAIGCPLSAIGVKYQVLNEADVSSKSEIFY